MDLFASTRVLRYSLAPLCVGLALALALMLKDLAPFATDYLFLAAVACAAWFGRRGPGLLAAAIAAFVLDYFFLPPLHTFGISTYDRPYVVPFILSALAAAWMSSTRRRAEESTRSLSREEESFRRILTNMPDVAWTADQTGLIVYISPKIEEILGYAPREIKDGGANFLLERVRSEDRARLAQSFSALFNSQRVFDEEFEIQAKDGRWVWVCDRAIRVYERNGVILTDGVLSDITKRKQAELALRSKTAFLEAQVNSTIDGILVVDEQGRRILQNQRMVEIFHIPAELMKSAMERPMLEYALGQIKNPAIFLEKVEYLYDHRDKSSRDEIELTDGTMLDRYSAPVVDRQGKYYGRIWSFRDVTDRKRDEDMVRQLTAAVEQSPSSIVITDPQGSIQYVNRKFIECTGYTLPEVLGKNPSILNSGRAPRQMFETIWQTILGGKEWRGEFCNKRKNGEIYWESAAICPIFDPRGNIAHFLAVKEDITQRRQLESDLRLAQKLEGIGQLAAGIAHEINTPTQFVMDNLSFLQGSWESIFRLLMLYRRAFHNSPRLAMDRESIEVGEAEGACDLEFVGKEVPTAIAESIEGAQRIANIVRAMKEFSHPDSVDKVETDLNKSIASTVTVARNEWKYTASLVTDFDESLPRVVCYPGDINQVVLNLIVNAAHAIKEKLRENEKGQIVVRTRRRGEYAEIAISDTGMGVAEEIRGRIFEPFFTTKEVGKGTGQGLSFAHGVVVKKHHGKIWFETETGEGTTFFIQLPVDGSAA